VHPSDFGLPTNAPEDLKGGDASFNANVTLRLLRGEDVPQRGIVLLNASAAIAAGTESQTIAECLPLARDAIDSGRALEKLRQLQEFTPR
jgi:anthranilate phosphoribosyltransferase